MGQVHHAAPGWRGTLALAAVLMLAACQPSNGAGETAAPSAERPMRIVSLDYCADQYLLRLADREQILAISPDGPRDFSYMRAAARGIPTVRPVAEDVMVLEPDLVIRTYGGGPNAEGFFERAGIPVLQIGYATTVDGAGMGSIPQLVIDVAAGLGHPERGTALATDYRNRLAAIEQRSHAGSALYMTAGGVTTGPGSLVHEMLLAAGLRNFEEQPGWHSLPLERLAYDQPDIVAAAFFTSRFNYDDMWSASQHPIARQLLETRETVALDGAWTACGGWFILDAIEALAEEAGS